MNRDFFVKTIAEIEPDILEKLKSNSKIDLVFCLVWVGNFIIPLGKNLAIKKYFYIT